MCIEAENLAETVNNLTNTWDDSLYNFIVYESDGSASTDTHPTLFVYKRGEHHVILDVGGSEVVCLCDYLGESIDDSITLNKTWDAIDFDEVEIPIHIDSF